MSADPLDELLSLADVAELTGRSPTTVREAVVRGKLHARYVGRDWVTTRAAVVDWSDYLARAPWKLAVGRRPSTRRVTRHS